MLTAVIRPVLSASIRGPACLRQQSVNSGRRGRTVSCDRQLLQLLVLRLGLLQGGDVGVGGFPEAEEVLVGSACARGIAQNHSQWGSGCLADFIGLTPPWKPDRIEMPSAATGVQGPCATP